jgi:hypothetical protein
MRQDKPLPHCFFIPCKTAKSLRLPILPPYFFSKSYGICYGGECGFYIDKRVQKVYTLVSSKTHSKGASYAENS